MSFSDEIKFFYAKLLLLGEHTVLRGSMALAFPYRHFGGRWAGAAPGQELAGLQRDLPRFGAYLKDLQAAGQLKCALRVDDFLTDLQKGLYFASDIPTGYGLGSSGALCAALYDRYCPEKIAPDESDRLAELKNVLAQLESFFHGASSGTDPLIIYLGYPVLIRSGGHITRTTLPALPEDNARRFFLLDTGIRRETGPLVNHFLDKSGRLPLSAILNDGLIGPTNKAVGHLLAGRWADLADEVRRISFFQMEQLPEMTPKAFHEVWKEGLSSDIFSLKLCGAGGGGFLLGFTENLPRTREMLGARGFELLEIEW